MDKPRIYMEKGFWRVKTTYRWWRKPNPSLQAAAIVFCDRLNYKIKIRSETK